MHMCTGCLMLARVPTSIVKEFFVYLLLLLLFVHSVLLLKPAMASTPSDFGWHHQFLRCAQALQVRTNIEHLPPESLCNPETRGKLHSHVMLLTGPLHSLAAHRKRVSTSHESLHNTGSRHWLSWGSLPTPSRTDFPAAHAQADFL